MNEIIPNTIILAYHNILKPGSKLSSDKGCISFDLLEEHIHTLSMEGYKNVSFEKAFVDLVENNTESREYAYAITFDDAYENLIEFLPDFLDKIRPTVFHITEYTGKSNMEWNTRTPVVQQHLNLEQLGKLYNLNVDIQFHGIDHHNLLKFEEKELHRRFKSGIKWFEKHFNFKPEYLAYPYGYCNKLVEKVTSLYFKGGITVSHGEWYGNKARFALNRLSVSNYLSGKDLLEIIRTTPEKRWFEKEKKAPWAKKKIK